MDLDELKQRAERALAWNPGDDTWMAIRASDVLTLIKIARAVEGRPTAFRELEPALFERTCSACGCLFATPYRSATECGRCGEEMLF